MNQDTSPSPVPAVGPKKDWSKIRSEILDPNTGPRTYKRWWIAPSQLAQIYLVTRDVVHKWMKSGVVTWVTLPGGKRVIPVEWVIANLHTNNRTGFAQPIEQRRFKCRRQAIKWIMNRLSVVVPNPDPLFDKAARA